MTFIDLFCGCGGFTLGMERAGFKCLAAIDFNEEAITTFKANFPKDVLALHKDLTKFTPDKLTAKLGTNHVDVIVGGPPCQGFSTVRQVDAANHGSRVKRDKRRYLYRMFLDYVSVFRPRIFIMENVMGIQSAAKGKFFTPVQADARKLGYRVHAQVEEAWKLGVPQKRRRQLVVGVLNDVPGYFPSELKPPPRAHGSPTLWDAIGDLPPLAAGEGLEQRDYDLDLRKKFLAERNDAAKNYLDNVLEITKAKKLTSHRARPHNDRDLRDFIRLHEGETAAAAIERGEKMEFPYDRSVFLDRYAPPNEGSNRLYSALFAFFTGLRRRPRLWRTGGKCQGVAAATPYHVGQLWVAVKTAQRAVSTRRAMPKTYKVAKKGVGVRKWFRYKRLGEYPQVAFARPSASFGSPTVATGGE